MMNQLCATLRSRVNTISQSLHAFRMLRVLLFNLSGHGLLDLSAYETYQTGKLQDV